MGTRLAKPPPLDRPIAPQSAARGRNPGIQRSFPVLTPQSYIPGGVGGYPGFPPMGGGSNFPVLSQNSFLPPPGTLEPPIMNFSGGPGGMMSPPSPFPPMMPPQMSLPPPPMPYPQQAMTMGPPSYYEPGLPSYSRRRPVRVCRRGRRSRRHRRPVIHVIDSSSCDSSSSYSTISSCSRRRHRSCSHSRRRGTPQQQQQQQPIILLPMPVQQPAPAIAAPVQNQIQQQQPQQIILPPIQVQQQGQYQPQQLALQGMPIQQQQQLALPPISFQQQPFGLSPYQLNSSNLVSSGHSSPLMIPSGQPMIQPSISMPQITNFGRPQQIQGGTLQYVQAARQSSSPLQYVSAERRSTTAPQRVLVNSTNKRQLTSTKPVRRSTSIRELPQNDLKFGRRPFDWYEGEKKNKIVNENVRAGHRRSTAVG